MTSLATTTATKPDAPAGAQPQAQPLPFILGSRQGRQSFHDRTDTLTGQSKQVGPIDVVARGYARALVLEVTLSGGAGGAAVVGDDDIFGIFDQVTLTDPAGATLWQTSGWNLYLANKYLGIGSLASLHDPKLSPFFSDVDADGNGSFKLRIPIEISARDGLGSLANRNASATFKLTYHLASSGTFFDTVPAGNLPDVQVKASLEYWGTVSQEAGARFNRPVATDPPAHGTMLMGTETPYNVSSGHQQVQLTRKGNYIRALLCTLRTAAGVRTTANLPDEVTFRYDGQEQDRASLGLLRSDIAERLGLSAAEDAAGGLDVGVLPFQWDDDLDGVPGNSMRTSLLPTRTSTDLVIEGNFGAAGVLTVCTVDIAPAGPIFG